jgi:outer membrane protein assembly factor BamB
LYAIDARSGATLWRFPTDGPILSSAAVSHGRVIVGTASGSLYAVDAASGRRLWRFRALGRGGFWAAPAVAGDLVLLGSRDKRFYAVDLRTGRQRWSFTARGWIVTPAAVGLGRVYFAAEDEMAAYCLRLADGRRAWRRPLPGQTFRDSWPVLNQAARRVIFTSMPSWPFHYNLREADNSVFGFTVGAGWALERKAILDYLSRWPTRQTVFCLDAATGRPTQTLPLLWSGGSGGPPTPPVLRPDGQGFVIFRSTAGIQNPPRNETVHVTSLWNSDLGLLDLATNDIRSLDSEEHAVGYHLISDETSTLSLAGRNLIVASWPEVGGIDTASGHMFTACIPSDDENLVGSGVNKASGVPRILQPGAPRPGRFAADAGGSAPAPVADGVLYWVWDQTLVVIEGTPAAKEGGTWRVRTATP